MELSLRRTNFVNMRGYRSILALIATLIMSLSVAHASLHSAHHHHHSSECSCHCGCDCACTDCLDSTAHQQSSCAIDTQYLPANDEQQEVETPSITLLLGTTPYSIDSYWCSITSHTYIDDDVGESCTLLRSESRRGPPSVC